MSELWTSPKAGPFPSSHLVTSTFWHERYQLRFVNVRCGRPRPQATDEQVAAFTSEPPPTSEGRTCETCLRLANRDHIEDPIAGNDPEREDDASTQPVEMLP